MARQRIETDIYLLNELWYSSHSPYPLQKTLPKLNCAGCAFQMCTLLATFISTVKENKVAKKDKPRQWILADEKSFSDPKGQKTRWQCDWWPSDIFYTRFIQLLYLENGLLGKCECKQKIGGQEDPFLVLCRNLSVLSIIVEIKRNTFLRRSFDREK